MTRRLLAEAAGTFALVLVGAGSVVVEARTGALGHTGVSLAFGIVVAAMVWLFGRISGAHINPAVTVAFSSAGHFPPREVAPYVLAQCAGALAAAGVLRAAFDTAGDVGATVPQVGAGLAFLIELVLSFVLMFAISFVALGGGASHVQAGVVVGGAVGLDAFFGGPFTGASMNPARTLGPAVASGVWDAHWIYWLAPMLGMAAAIRIFELLRRWAGATPAGPVPEPERLGVEGELPPP